jgi:elongation factor P--beta-lysine ligase
MTVDFQKQFVKEWTQQFIRKYLIDHKFHEVDTPTFLPSLPLEPGLYAFTTHWHQKNLDFYLATSPESSLKKIIADGIGNCFSISKAFRDLEDIGPTHNLEFFMLEWYEMAKNYRDIAKTTEKLINYIYLGIQKKLNIRTTSILTYQNQTIDLSPPWYRFSLNDLFIKHTGIDLSKNFNFVDFQKSALEKNFPVSSFTDWEQIFSYLMITEVESHLPKDKPVFIFDYPTLLSPLCQPCPNLPGFSERFELYIGGMEIGNAYTELTDANVLEANFKQEEVYRQKNHLPTHPYDQKLVESTRHFPSCTGIAIGVDRLSMLMANAATIDEILYFPTSKLIE